MTDHREPAGGAVDAATDALERAGALSEVGRHADAEAVVRRALATDPDDAALRAALAQVLLVRERPREALEHARAAVALAPEVPFAHALLSTVLATDLRSRREAVDVARAAVRLDPEDPFSHMALARACLRSRWFPEALDAAERAVALDPEDAGAHATRGAALMGVGRPDDAEVAYREALRIAPGDGDAMHALGIVLDVLGRDRREEARGLFAEAARADPTDARARGAMASATRRAVYGRWAWLLVAFAVLRAAIYLVGDDPVARWPGTVAWGLVAAAVAAFLLVRGRRRRRALSGPERTVLRESGLLRRLRGASPRRRGRGR